MTRNELTNIVSHAARYGHVTLDAIESIEDMRLARKFSTHFHAAVQGLADALVMDAVKAAQAKGKRTFRKGCGVWLTEKEYNA
tara:strand:+ start:764 stop:1012 length:249 start_codon:yes stop_codon:yes gene_type:complete